MSDAEAETPPQPAFRIRGEQDPLVAQVLQEAGWVAAAEGTVGRLNWDCDPPGGDDFTAAAGRFFNRIPGSDGFAMKARLHKALKHGRARAEREGRAERFDFHPRTFLLPDDVPEFHAASRRMPGDPWIWRYRAVGPSGKAAILGDAQEAGASARYLIQEYLGEPHLLDGYKYTLRFFILVQSIEPLVAWISERGLCRFASRPFSYAPEQRKEKHIHSTAPEALADDEQVSLSWQNLGLDTYRAKLFAAGVDDAALFGKIEALLQTALAACRESVVRVAAEDKAAFAPGQFELFAADVALDESLKPWLLGFRPNLRFAVGSARTLPVAAHEEELLKSVLRESFALVGALAGEPPSQPDSLEGWRAWLAAHDARAKKWQRLFPNPHSPPALLDFEKPRPADLMLALLSRPPEQRSFTMRAHATPIDGGLLLASDHGEHALLEGAAASLWQRLAHGDSPEGATEGDEAERFAWLTDWLRRGLLAAEPPPPSRARPPTRWNGGRFYSLDGLKFLVRTGGAELEPLVHPLLAPFECTPSGTPDRVVDLVHHAEGFALFDGEGKRRWQGAGPELGARLLEWMRAESMRAACRLGAFEALWIREKRLLIVPERGLFRGLAEALAPLGLDAIGAPVFLSAQHELEAATLANGADGLHANHILFADVDRAKPEELSALAPFAALRKLLGAARGLEPGMNSWEDLWTPGHFDAKPIPPALQHTQVTPRAAQTLARAMNGLVRDQLLARDVASAAKQIAARLGASKLAALPEPLRLVKSDG